MCVKMHELMFFLQSVKLEITDLSLCLPPCRSPLLCRTQNKSFYLGVL